MATIEPPPSLLTLPDDVRDLIFVKLGRGQGRARDIARTAGACRVFRAAARIAEQAHRRVCYEGHTTSVCAAAATNGRIVTGSSDKTIKVWRDGACERTIQLHTEPVTAVAVLPGGARFVSVSYDDRTAKLWTLDGALERTLGSRVICVAALPDGVHFVVGTSRPYSEDEDLYEVRLYHVDGTLVHTFEGHTNVVHVVVVTPDGQHIISGSFDKTVKAWSVANKSLVSTCVGHTDVCAVAAMPDGQRILSGADDKTVRVWHLNGTLKNTFKLHTSYVMALVALPDHQHALSASMDKTVKLFNVDDGAVLRTFTHHTAGVNCLALLPDGLRFVSGSDDGTARIVEIGPLYTAPWVRRIVSS